MKNKIILALFLIFGIILFWGCSGGNNPAMQTQVSNNPTPGPPSPLELNGFVYRSLTRDERAVSQTGLLVTNTPITSYEYEPVINATVFLEKNPQNKVMTDSSGEFTFAGISAGEYNAVINPSTSTNAGNYASTIETFAVANEFENPQITSIKVVPVNCTVVCGKTKQFRVVAYDGGGNALPASSVTWTVKGIIGHIDQYGLFTATNAGRGMVYATYGTLTSYSDVRVIKGTIDSGILIGTVSSGATPLEDIVVKIEDLSLIGVTDINGEYIIPEIPPGTYTVSATQNGKSLGVQQAVIIEEQTTECNFIVNPFPDISGINPSEGYIGDTVTINGKYFGENKGSSIVTLNGLEANLIISWSDTLIKCAVPYGASTGDIKIVVNSQESNSVLYTLLQKYGYVSNLSSNNISVLDLTSNTVLKTVSVGTKPGGISITPDGNYAYIANWASNNISILDTKNNEIVDTISVQEAPAGIAFTPDGKWGYVVNEESGSISIIDTKLKRVDSTIQLSKWLLDISFSLDGRFAYITRQDPFGTGSVIKIDTTTKTAVNTTGLQEWPNAIGITPDGNYLYIANAGSNNVLVLNTSSDTITSTIPLPGDWTGAMAIDKAGDFAYVSTFFSNLIIKINIHSNTVVNTISTENPWGIALTPNGRYAYVANRNTDKISIIDLSTDTVIGYIPVGDEPVGITIMP